jgi:hypothetical protein
MACAGRTYIPPCTLRCRFGSPRSPVGSTQVERRDPATFHGNHPTIITAKAASYKIGRLEYAVGSLQRKLDAERSESTWREHVAKSSLAAVEMRSGLAITDPPKTVLVALVLDKYVDWLNNVSDALLTYCVEAERASSNLGKLSSQYGQVLEPSHNAVAISETAPVSQLNVRLTTKKVVHNVQGFQQRASDVWKRLVTALVGLLFWGEALNIWAASSRTGYLVTVTLVVMSAMMAAIFGYASFLFGTLSAEPTYEGTLVVWLCRAYWPAPKAIAGACTHLWFTLCRAHWSALKAIADAYTFLWFTLCRAHWSALKAIAVACTFLWFTLCRAHWSALKAIADACTFLWFLAIPRTTETTGTTPIAVSTVPSSSHHHPTITPPSPHHHHTITTTTHITPPSPHHHHTITTPSPHHYKRHYTTEDSRLCCVAILMDAYMIRCLGEVD